MATGAVRETAKIIPFIPRARLMAGLGGQATRNAEMAPQRYPSVDCGSGWYHEAAMQEEAERARKS